MLEHRTDDGDNEARSPGRARRTPLKPLRGECRADRRPAVTNSCAFLLCTRGCGCARRARHSLRPLISEGQGSCTTRALTAPRGGEGVFEIAHRGRPCLVRNCAQEQGPPRERSSSRRRVGCIERRLSEAFAQQRRSVVMGPCFRRDDIAGCLKFKLVREAAELGADRNHQHHAAGIAQIFRVMAEGRRQRADVARPLCPIEIWSAACQNRNPAAPSKSAIRKQIPAM